MKTYKNLIASKSGKDYNILYMGRISAKTAFIGIVCSAAFVVLLICFFGHVQDDAYIGYRYSKNLAQGYGIVWNKHEDPVEGYTNFLWVILNAGAIFCKLDPVIFSKIISSILSLAIVWILLISCREMHWSLVFVFVGAIAFNPQFAFLSTQGLETAPTAFVLLLVALLSIKIMALPSPGKIFFWYVAAFVAALLRPDTIPFSCGVSLGMLGISWFRKELIVVKNIISFGVIFALLGMIYMAWRISYFGYFFPNTYYIKMGDGTGFIKNQGRLYVESFIHKVLFAYIPLITFLMGKYVNKEKFLKVLPVIAGCCLFGVYLLSINPIQGALWRFIQPVYPAFLLALIFYFSDFKPVSFKFKTEVLCLFLVLFFIFWNLRLISKVFYRSRYINQFDRVVVGKKLADINGTLLTSESGALPFYSDWKAVDLLGLNSEKIVHEGLSTQFLEELNPDLVMLRARQDELGGFRPRREDEMIVYEYMKKTDFVAVATICKSPLSWHHYFVRGNSELFEGIVERLLEIEELTYSNEIDGDGPIPVYQSQ